MDEIPAIRGVQDGREFYTVMITMSEATGRERRIQEWKDKKEDLKFAKLVDQLQKRNSARRARHDPERRKQIAENQRRHRASGRKQERANELRREKYEADPVVNVCEECGESEVVNDVGIMHTRKELASFVGSDTTQKTDGMIDRDA